MAVSCGTVIFFIIVPLKIIKTVYFHKYRIMLKFKLYLWKGVNIMKRIVTIQDISCVGKCSLTVALPIISATGVEAAIVPTAVLSTHTMFQNFTVKDLTDQIQPIADHWKSEGFKFDAIYTGYLGSSEQIDLVINFFDTFKTDSNFIFVDPAMADNGKLYPAFDAEFPKLMAKVCAKADIIVPNLTEACLMTDIEYKTEYDMDYVQTVLKALAQLGAEKVVLTGVNLGDKYGVAGYDSKNDKFFTYYHEKLAKSYHGTGDVFSSTCVGALANGKTLEEAIQIAADYTVECIRITSADPESNDYGVDFERAIPFLLEKLGK